MRSRFTAFAMREWDYLDKTRYPGGGRGDKARSDSPRDTDKVWTRLEILDTRDGGHFDNAGEVTFIAHYREDGKEGTLHERSRFIRENGKWYYDEQNSEIVTPSGPSSSKPMVRDQPKVGRNDPCPCGSGKKFKKCCGK